jgi:ribosomal protein S18 acetylase RimI-like enzyme
MATPRETIDRYFSIRLGISLPDLKPGQVAVAWCDRRTYQERGYGMIPLLSAYHFGDRAAISVHPSALAEVSRLAWKLDPDQVLGDDFCEKAASALRSALSEPGLAAGSTSIKLYHPGGATPAPSDGEIRALTPSDKGRWSGPRQFMSAVEHPSSSRGEAFGLFLGERLVGEIITHEPAVAAMAGLIAEDGIEVAEDCRGRGYGKALLSHWTWRMQGKGRACIHGTALTNQASIATARSVGYVEYARSRGVSYVTEDD